MFNMFHRASHGKDAAGNLPYGHHEPPSFDLLGKGEPEAPEMPPEADTYHFPRHHVIINLATLSHSPVSSQGHAQNSSHIDGKGKTSIFFRISQLHWHQNSTRIFKLLISGGSNSFVICARPFFRYEHRVNTWLKWSQVSVNIFERDLVGYLEPCLWASIRDRTTRKGDLPS